MNLIERVSAFFQRLNGSTDLLVATLVAVLAFTVLYFFFIKFLVNNDAEDVVTIFAFVMFISAAVVSMVDAIDNEIFLVVPAICIMVGLNVYAVELKRIIWAKHNVKLFDIKKSEGVKYDEEKIQHCISEIIKALQNMSKNDVGAILVLSTGNIPSQIIDSGVKLESDISSELIESVFFPKTPLHDGAMIINGAKIVAAGCFLPLSQNLDNIPKDLGTRHRAGIGVTETIDVISIIVSEETGIISIARGGKITRYADTESLKNILGKYYWQELESARR
ncbi:MAG: diadenylate cyclase [Clostridia bacterium]|nr:diadenylate cyclase [Clostridia bacterium]